MRARIGANAHVFRQVWRNKDLRRVELAFVGFSLAEHATWVAMLVFAFNVGGATATGTVGVIQLVPAALLAPVAATFGDRFRRDRVLMGGYLIQAAAMTLTAAVIFADAPTVLAYASGAAVATSVTFTRPVQSAILPTLSETPAELTAGNVVSGAIQGVGLFGGPALTGVILAVSGPASVFAVTAAVCLASAFGVSRLSIPALPSRGAAATSESVLANVRAGFRATRSGGAETLIGLLATHAAVVGAVEVLLVVLGLEMLRVGDSGVGFLNAAFGAGSAAGAVVAALLVGRKRLEPALMAGAVAWALALGSIALLPTTFSATVLIVLAGMGRTVIEVGGQTLLQRVMPDRVLSRVFGLLEGLTMVGLGLGFAVVPFLFAVAGNRPTFVVVGAVLVVFVLATRTRLTRLDASADLPEERIALLRGVPFLASLGQLTLERLARRLVAVDLPAGTVVIRYGDVGDRFYVVDQGEVEVTVAGRRIDAHGPGGFVGEIALLKDVPRTADVTAVTDVRLFALDRDDFLEAVAGHDESRGAADSVVVARLARRDAVQPRGEAASDRANVS